MSGPVTAIFENMGKSTPKVERQKVWISSLEPGSWPAKSLAGKPRTSKPQSLVAGVELFEGLVLGGEAALRGDVDDEQDLAAVVGEGGGFAGDACGRGCRRGMWTWTGMMLLEERSVGTASLTGYECG